MAEELDLEKGDPQRAERITERLTGGGAAKSTEGKKEPVGRRKSGQTGRQRAASRVTEEVDTRFKRVLTRISEMLAVKGDDELADAISDNRDEMTQGFVSLTRNIPWLRGPFIMFLNLIEPTLAFWRVGTILASRWYERRNRPMTPEEIAEVERRNAEFAAQHPAPAV